MELVMPFPVREMNTENLDWINHIFASNLTSKAKLIGSLLGSYMHGCNEAYPGLARLTFESSMSRRSVQNAIDELSREGWIVKKSGGITATGSLSPNHYQRSWKNDTRMGRGLGPSISENAAEPMAQGAQSRTPTARGMAQDAIPCGTDYHTPWHQLPTNKIDNKIDNVIHMVIDDDRPTDQAKAKHLKPENQALSNDQEIAATEKAETKAK